MGDFLNYLLFIYLRNDLLMFHFFSFSLDIDEVPFLNLGISKANLLIGLKTHTVPCTIVKTIYLSIFQVWEFFRHVRTWWVCFFFEPSILTKFQSFFDELQGRGTDASNQKSIKIKGKDRTWIIHGGQVSHWKIEFCMYHYET
jgi:hypothetical protein